MRVAVTNPTRWSSDRYSETVDWLSPHLLWICPTHTPAPFNSPKSCTGKCVSGSLSQVRICNRVLFERALKTSTWFMAYNIDNFRYFHMQHCNFPFEFSRRLKFPCFPQRLRLRRSPNHQSSWNFEWRRRGRCFLALNQINQLLGSKLPDFKWWLFDGGHRRSQ